MAIQQPTHPVSASPESGTITASSDPLLTRIATGRPITRGEFLTLAGAGALALLGIGMGGAYGFNRLFPSSPGAVPPVPGAAPTASPGATLAAAGSSVNILPTPNAPKNMIELLNQFRASPEAVDYIRSYAVAYGVTPDSVNLLLKNYKDINNNEVYEGVTDDEKPIAISTLDGGETRFQAATLRELGRRTKMGFGGDLGNVDMIGPTVARHFNIATITNFDWQNLEPKRGEVQYRNADYALTFAKKSNFSPIAGHRLIAPQRYPAWIKNGSFSREEMVKIIQGWVGGTVSRFKGNINIWDVVNEFHPENWGVPDILQRNLGDEVLYIAYQAARDADPSALLRYNDDHNETPNGRATPLTLAIVNKLKSRGLIDLVGLEMHLDGANPPSKEDIIKTMKGYELPVCITELDVNLRNVQGTPKERFTAQAQIYKNVVQAAFESGVCNSITFWTPGDSKNSWLATRTDVAESSPNAQATLFDDNAQPMRPKLAYFEVLTAVNGFLLGKS